MMVQLIFTYSIFNWLNAQLNQFMNNLKSLKQ